MTSQQILQKYLDFYKRSAIKSLVTCDHTQRFIKYKLG